MKWLEGWFGALSGILGSALIIAALLNTSLYSQRSRSCFMPSGYNFCGGGYPPSPDSVDPRSVVIPVGIIVLLYIGVLAGTWLDLRGKRTMGRLVLLVSSLLLIPAWMVGAGLVVYLRGSGPSGELTISAFALTPLAFVTGILACARPDMPSAEG